MAHPMQHYGERKPPEKTSRELIDNLYDWLYVILNRLDQLENPGMEPQWPEENFREKP